MFETTGVSDCISSAAGVRMPWKDSNSVPILHQRLDFCSKQGTYGRRLKADECHLCVQRLTPGSETLSWMLHLLVRPKDGQPTYIPYGPDENRSYIDKINTSSR